MALGEILKNSDIIKVRGQFKFEIIDGSMQFTPDSEINKTKDRGGRVIACGTTSCRTIESACDDQGKLSECSGDTSIFIYPGYKFKCLDALITNFHLPESTLVMLVSAFAPSSTFEPAG